MTVAAMLCLVMTATQGGARASANELASELTKGSNGASKWVLDPMLAGLDRPPVGVSLFDLVTTTTEGRREVPFPYEKLVQRLEAAAGCSATARCVRSVLLPLGRSLQRVAASPDYFEYPRIVSAVVADGRGPWLLRDRLYLGYQERAAIVEVISYNELAGRFEFQVVKDYRAGATPRVFHARRAVCLACHQNHAPIFSRQVWDETNANPAVAAKLGTQRSAYHGVGVRGSSEMAKAIDDATDRSNRLALLGKLWSGGCGGGGAGDRCRVAAFLGALQLAFTERRAYDVGSESFRNDAVATLLGNARRLWPGGLAVPNPDLPNRDPFSPSLTTHPLALAHVPAQLEPLLPRPALEVLPADGAQLSGVLVRTLAESLPIAAVDELSDALSRRAKHTNARQRSYRGPCKMRSTAGVTRFDCDGGLQLSGIIDGNSASVDALGINAGEVLRNVRLPVQYPRVLTILPKVRGRSLRLPDGNAVASIAIDARSIATLTVVEDFELLRTPIAEAIAASNNVPHAALSRTTAQLNGSALELDSAVVAPAIVEPIDSPPDAAGLTAPFASQCGACHHTADSTPPNFLTGNARQVERSLQSCAPRIYVRLAMNDVPSARRAKTPMPPEVPVISGQPSRSADVRLLRARIEAILQREYGRVPQVHELLRDGYESLRPCLPGGTA